MYLYLYYTYPLVVKAVGAACTVDLGNRLSPSLSVLCSPQVVTQCLVLPSLSLPASPSPSLYSSLYRIVLASLFTYYRYI